MGWTSGPVRADHIWLVITHDGDIEGAYVHRGRAEQVAKRLRSSFTGGGAEVIQVELDRRGAGWSG